MKVPKKKKIKKNIYFSVFIKLAIIFLFIIGYLWTNETFSNEIKLLAVNENPEGEPTSGSIINLELKIRPGSGNVYVNLNTIEEIDTQISIINSQKIACRIFELNCESYDFFYEFTGSALVLKGPSASSAIAILTAKTLNNEIIENDVVITGSLNSGGIVGAVGGIEEKVMVAKQEGFNKVLIPYASEYEGNVSGIEVIKVLDVVEAYNEFNGNNYELDSSQINKEDYNELMKNLGEMMCQRANELQNQINIENITENSTISNYLEQAKRSLNSSQIAKENENYYSMGSFCYNSNINFRIILELQKNLSNEELNLQIKDLREEIIMKSLDVNSDEYKEQIQTMNDFYTYLLINDRIEEATEYIIDANKINMEDFVEKSQTNNNNNNTNISTNQSNTTIVNEQDNIELKIREKVNLYSFAKERFYTVSLWEQFLDHTGKEIVFDERNIENACMIISREIVIKAQLMNNYGINFFNEEIQKQNTLSSADIANKYLCIYRGLELQGRMNTVINSIGVEQNQTESFAKTLLNFTESRISLNSENSFPLIPYIYYEYSGDLLEQNDVSSSILYSNYALSYSDLNLYLEEKKIGKSFFSEVINRLYENPLFVLAILLIIAFS